MEQAEYWSDSKGEMVVIFMLTDEEILFHVRNVGLLDLENHKQLKQEYERRNLQSQ